MFGNVDFTPTILDFGGVTDTIEDEMDGKSMKEILLHHKLYEETFDFRQYFLNEYHGCVTQYNAHAGMCQDTTTSELCSGLVIRSHSGPVGPDSNTKPDDYVESEGVGKIKIGLLIQKIVTHGDN